MSEYQNSFDTGSTDSSDASVKDKAADSAQAGKQAATDVAQTAAAKAQDVVGEGKAQAAKVVGQARDQLRTHVDEQQSNAVSTLRSLGDQLQAMVDSGRESDESGVATDLVGQAADRAHGVASWLDGKSPEQLVDEVRRFARRRPGAFIAGALVAGVVAGRLTRGVVASHTDDSANAPVLNDSGRHAVADSAGPAQITGDPTAGGVLGYDEQAAPTYSAGGFETTGVPQTEWEPATYVEPRAGL